MCVCVCVCVCVCTRVCVQYHSSFAAYCQVCVLLFSNITSCSPHFLLSITSLPVGCTHSPVVLQTELIPYMAVINCPLKSSGKLHPLVC